MTNGTIDDDGDDDGDGFGSNGWLDWVELFKLLPRLKSFSVDGTNLRLMLPDRLPIGFELTLSYTHGLRGSIPSTLFENYRNASSTGSLNISLTVGRLNGTIPADLFAPLAGNTFSKFHFALTYQRLTGPLPSPLPDDMVIDGPEDVSFVFNMAYNKLYGSIAEHFVVPILGTGADVHVSLAGNHFTGTYPSAFFRSMSPLRSFSFKLNSNYLSGTLPAKMLTATLQPSASSVSVEFNVNSNQLSGTIPECFFSSTFNSADFSLSRISLDFALNYLQGSVSPHIIRENINNSLSLQYLSLNLGSNALTGTLPPSLLTNLFSSSSSDETSLALDFSFNLLEGSLSAAYAEAVRSLSSIKLRLNNNYFSASIPAFCSSGIHPSTYWLQLNNNQFNGSLPDAWNAVCGLKHVSIRSNPLLSGTIPNHFLNMTHLRSFYASNTNLSGNLPPVHHSLENLDLSNSALSFCSEASRSSITIKPRYVCRLRCTDASECATSSFPGCDLSCPVCSPSTAPSPAFKCIDDMWTASQFSNSTLVVPRNARMAITGDLSATTVEFHDMNSTLHIGGCAPNLATVSFKLLAADADNEIYNHAYGHGLIFFTAQSPPPCHNASKLAIHIESFNCRKLRLEPMVTQQGRYQEYFSAHSYFTSSGCNRSWIIIIISVLIPVIIIGIVVSIVAVVLCGKKSNDYMPVGQ